MAGGDSCTLTTLANFLLVGESDVKPCGQPGFSWPYFDLGMDQNIEAFFFDAKLVGSGRDAGETAASREIRFTV
jgi:hypothetical protein